MPIRSRSVRRTEQQKRKERFGKCVSAKADEVEETPEEETPGEEIPVS